MLIIQYHSVVRPQGKGRKSIVKYPLGAGFATGSPGPKFYWLSATGNATVIPGVTRKILILRLRFVFTSESLQGHKIEKRAG